MIQNSPNPANPQQSVSRWIDALQNGQHFAAERLWGFLHRRLMSHAERQVRFTQPSYDEEDVALSAFGALCDGLEKGRYLEIENRTDLWKLLAVITTNKAKKRAEHENRLKRGGDHNRVADGDAFLDLLCSPDPPPELALSMREECEKKLNSLQEDELKMVVLLKVEGYTNDEIASNMGCTRRSIQRRLALIRDIWSENDRA